MKPTEWLAYIGGGTLLFISGELAASDVAWWCAPNLAGWFAIYWLVRRP